MWKHFVVLLLVLAACLSFSSCKSPTDSADTNLDPASSKVKSDQAYQMIENEMMTLINGNFNSTAQFDQLKFKSALALYNEALIQDPKNNDARFGAAVTEILSAYYDSEINSLVKDIDSASMSGNSTLKKLLASDILPVNPGKVSFSAAPAAAGLIFSLQTALKDPPLISRVQKVLKNNFMPKVQSAIDHLAQLEGNESFKFTITGKMQGDISLKPVSIYPTEVALMSSALHMLKFGIQMSLIYNFDLPDYKQSTLLSYLSQSNTGFFVLQPDGKQMANDARSSFNAAITKAQKAVDYLKRISGNKSDAVIKLGSGGIKNTDLDTVSVYLNKALTALSSDLSLYINDGDSDGNPYTIKINLGNWLTNPPQNPKKDLLPAYTLSPVGTKEIKFLFNAETYTDFNFPDPTFGGLLPGMQQETLKRLLYIDEEYQYEMYGYLNIYPVPSNYNSTSKQGITVKIYTSETNYYPAVTDAWGNFTIRVRDASTIPQPVYKYTVVVNGTETEMQNISKIPFAGIKARAWTYCEIKLTLQPKNLAVTKMTSPRSASLTWQISPSYSIYDWTNCYKVQRKTGTESTYSDISASPDYYNLKATDANVSTGSTYYYRIRTLAPSEIPAGYGSICLVNKNIIYSNEASASF